jgi:hypothetical protein
MVQMSNIKESVLILDKQHTKNQGWTRGVIMYFLAQMNNCVYKKICVFLFVESSTKCTSFKQLCILWLIIPPVLGQQHINKFKLLWSKRLRPIKFCKSTTNKNRLFDPTKQLEKETNTKIRKDYMSKCVILSNTKRQQDSNLFRSNRNKQLDIYDMWF